MAHIDFNSELQVAHEPTEPYWVERVTLGSPYEEEMDVRARTETFRHRPRSYTGEVPEPWRPGPAPRR